MQKSLSHLVGSAVALVLVLASVATCAPERPSALPGYELYWPPPPSKAEARFLGALPDEVMDSRPRSGWQKTWDFLIGTPSKPSAPPALLRRPFGVAARGDDLWVADPGGAEVLHIEWRKHSVTPVVCEGRGWGLPMAVTVATDGNLYVADSGAGLLLRVAPGGGCAAFGAGALVRPTGVAVLGDHVYVVDPPAHSVVEFASDGHEVHRFGVRGEQEGKLNFPTGIAARPDGTLLVVDSLNFRVVAFSKDGSYVSSFGSAGDGDGAFGRPKAVGVDERGRIYVSDAQNDVVIVFDAQGTFDFAIGGSGDGPGQLTLPAGVALSGDMLFVADSYNHRIAAYQLLGEVR